MKILLVRLSSMGDLIHTLPAVEDLARQCPEVELHWLCEAGFADIARLHPFVKKVHVMKWRQWRKHLFQAETWREIGRLKTDLQAESFDFVLDSQGLIKAHALPKWRNPLFTVWINTARVKVWLPLHTVKHLPYRKVKMRSGETVNYSPKHLVIQCLKRRYLVCWFLNQAV